MWRARSRHLEGAKRFDPEEADVIDWSIRLFSLDLPSEVSCQLYGSGDQIHLRLDLLYRVCFLVHLAPPPFKWDTTPHYALMTSTPPPTCPPPLLSSQIRTNRQEQSVGMCHKLEIGVSQRHQMRLERVRAIVEQWRRDVVFPSLQSVLYRWALTTLSSSLLPIRRLRAWRVLLRGMLRNRRLGYKLRRLMVRGSLRVWMSRREARGESIQWAELPMGDWLSCLPGRVCFLFI